MRTAISPGQRQPWTAVSALLGLISMALKGCFAPASEVKGRLHMAFNSRKGQRTNQKYRNLVGSDQQMQRLA